MTRGARVKPFLLVVLLAIILGGSLEFQTAEYDYEYDGE
jgi:hypothetical protein